MKIATVLAIIGSCFISAHGDDEISLGETQLITEHTANITSYTLVEMENGCKPSLDCIYVNKRMIETCIVDLVRNHTCGVPKIRLVVKKWGVDFYRYPAKGMKSNFLSIVAITPDLFDLIPYYKWRTTLTHVMYNFTTEGIPHVSIMRVGGTTLETLTDAKMARVEEVQSNRWKQLIKPITIQTREANYLLMDWPIPDSVISLGPEYTIAVKFRIEPEIPLAEE